MNTYCLCVRLRAAACYVWISLYLFVQRLELIAAFVNQLPIRFCVLCTFETKNENQVNVQTNKIILCIELNFGHNANCVGDMENQMKWIRVSQYEYRKKSGHKTAVKPHESSSSSFHWVICILYVALYAFFPVPFVIVWIEWTLGTFICKTVSYMQGVSVSASVNTLMAISIERCIAISCPYVSITSRWVLNAACPLSIHWPANHNDFYSQSSIVLLFPFLKYFQ